MLFPEPMTEVELIVPSKDLLAVTKVLGNRGVFHQIDSTYLGLENLGPNTWQEKAAAYSTLERRIQVIMQNLNIPEEYSAPSNIDSVAELEPIQKRYADLAADPAYVADVFAAGAERCRQVTAPVLLAAEAAIGLR